MKGPSGRGGPRDAAEVYGDSHPPAGRQRLACPHAPEDRRACPHGVARVCGFLALGREGAVGCTVAGTCCLSHAVSLPWHHFWGAEEGLRDPGVAPVHHRVGHGWPVETRAALS